MSGRYKGELVPEYVVNMEAVPAVYSTDELVVGVWTDGKPLYRKIIFPNVLVSTNTFAAVANISSLNIDTCVRLDGIGLDGDKNPPYIRPTQSDAMCLVMTNDRAQLLFYTRVANYRLTQVELLYTKTTDTPVSNVNAVFPSGNYFVEEYDTDDGWHVRKYSDGYCECRTEITHTFEVADWGEYGQGFSTTGSNGYFSNKAYPIEIVDPIEFANVHSLNGVGTIINSTIEDGKVNNYGILRMSKPTIPMSYVLSVLVTGHFGNEAATPMVIPELDLSQFDIQIAPGSYAPASAAASTGLTFR